MKNKEINIEKRDSADRAPLHLAARRGRTETVALLLDRGADINATDNYRWTPLHLAANWGHTKTVALLKKRGAKL